MITLMVVLGATLTVDQVALHWLLADVRLAMKRCDLSMDYVARCIGIPPCKLSLQLNGHAPFTSFWRLFACQELRDTDFQIEFLDIQARRVDRALVAVDLSRLLAGVEQLTSSLRNRDEEAA